jgi:hypothetical protein
LQLIVQPVTRLATLNVYICDRFVVPVLSSEEQRAVGEGELSLDEMTRTFIRRNLAYRFVVLRDGAEALRLEGALRRGDLRAGRPFLNPA